MDKDLHIPVRSTVLRRKFTVYVPGTSGGVIDAEMQMATKVANEFSTMFGHCTVTEGKVKYINTSGTLVEEPVTLVTSFTDDAGHRRHSDEVFALAEEVAIAMRQERIFVEDDGIAHEIRCGKPGRKNTTRDIADFANERRPKQTWKDISKEWNENHLGQHLTPNNVREAWRRGYGDKCPTATKLRGNR